MNYTSSAADEYKLAFSALPIWLQEQVLDEVELLLAHPEQLIVRGSDGLAMHDFVRKGNDASHVIFLAIRPDATSQTLALLRIGHVERR